VDKAGAVGSASVELEANGLEFSDINTLVLNWAVER